MSGLVAGVGMVKFSKPGTQDSHPLVASQAIRAALDDAGLTSRTSTRPSPDIATAQSPAGSGHFTKSV